MPLIIEQDLMSLKLSTEGISLLESQLRQVRLMQYGLQIFLMAQPTEQLLDLIKKVTFLNYGLMQQLLQILLS